MESIKRQENRVVVAYWKSKEGNPMEVFSSLKNFCLAHPSFNYNTLNNYLGKKKIPYENFHVLIQRKSVLGKPEVATIKQRQMVPVLRQTTLREANDDQRDLAYWFTKTPQDRLSALTSLVTESLSAGQRMDKSIFKQRKLK
ncbi:MAG: hypothetical protein V4456_15925 [Bacteroidota bacterium]